MVEIAPEEFEQLVVDALDSLPEELARLMDNVAVFVEDHPAHGELALGLYEGVPLTERSEYGGLSLPDRITVYRIPICEMCTDRDEVAEQVAITVIHEVAHHFGIPDDRLSELGWG